MGNQYCIVLKIIKLISVNKCEKKS